MRLYEFTEAYAGLMAMLEECETEEQRASVWGEIEQVEAGLTDKADAYARALRNAAAEEQAIATEIKRLQGMQKARKNDQERIKRNMQYALEIAGATELKTDIGKWSIRKNPLSVEIKDGAQIPERFLIPQPPQVDKKALIAEHKQTGECFEGVEFVQREGVQFR